MKIFERAYVRLLCPCGDMGPGTIYYLEDSSEHCLDDAVECDACQAVWTRREMSDEVLQGVPW